MAYRHHNHAILSRLYIFTEPTVTKGRGDLFNEINPLGAKTRRVLVALLATLVLFLLGGCTTAPKINSQTMVHETGCWSSPLDASETMYIFQMTGKADVRQISAKDPKDNDQLAQEGNSLWIEGERREAFSLAHWFTNEDSTIRQDSPKGNVPHSSGSRRDLYFESSEPLYPRIPLSKGISPIGDQTVLLYSSTDSPSENTGSDRGYALPSEEKAPSNQEKKALTDQFRDWKGIGRDTAYFMGYQVVVAGALYLLPESVTKWTDEQKRATVNKWAENVQSATWDKDPAWINYIGHPYWGATYYIRARERGFGEFSSFIYSAFLSALYEYGIEAFFERPSYQDLIVTPVGGILIGKFIFEPIRASIKSKTELAWHDHLLLILTDPLGAANGLVDRSLGIKSNVRLAIPGLTPPLQVDHSSYHAARSLKWQDENRSHRHVFGIGFDLMW
jgi:hypothetical protein